MKISEIITDKYKLRIPPNVYYDLLADVREAEEKQEPCEDATLKDIFCIGCEYKEQKSKSEWQKDHEILKAYSDGANDVLDEIKADIEQTTSRYCLSIEHSALGHVVWSDRLIKESEVLEIIDKYKAERGG